MSMKQAWSEWRPTAPRAPERCDERRQVALERSEVVGRDQEVPVGQLVSAPFRARAGEADLADRTVRLDDGRHGGRGVH
jgi:hypothetical protein